MGIVKGFDCVRVSVAAAVAVLLTGCLSAPFQPPQGMVSVSRAPLSTDGNWQVGAKQGSAKAKCLLGIAAWGDCSVTAAARNGGLKSVDYLDYKYLNVIGIWQEVEVVAYGE